MRGILPVDDREVPLPKSRRLRGRPLQPAEGCGSAVDSGRGPGTVPARPLHQNTSQSLIASGSGAPGLNLLATSAACRASGGTGQVDWTRQLAHFHARCSRSRTVPPRSASFPHVFLISSSALEPTLETLEHVRNEEGL